MGDLRSAIAFDSEAGLIFGAFYGSLDPANQRAWRQAHKRRHFTAMQYMLSGTYRGKWGPFWLWDDPDAVSRQLEELLDDAIRPWLWLANGESFRARQLGADATNVTARARIVGGEDVIDRDGVTVRVPFGVPINTFLTTADGFGAAGFATRAIREVTLEAAWDRMLPILHQRFGRDLIVEPAPEMNDIWSPEQQHRYTVLARQYFPDSYLVVRFTRARCHGDHNRGTGPDGNPPAAWSPTPDPNNPGQLCSNVIGYWTATPANALAYNVPYAHLTDLEAFTDDFGDVLVRVDGRHDIPGKRAPYPGMARDVIYAEGPAEWILQGRWTYAQGDALRRAALRLPGLTQIGD